MSSKQKIKIDFIEEKLGKLVHLFQIDLFTLRIFFFIPSKTQYFHRYQKLLLES